MAKSILLHDIEGSKEITCTKFFQSYYDGNTYYVIEYNGYYAFVDIIDGSWVRIPNKDFELFEKIIFSENQKELDINELPNVLKYVDPSIKKEPERVIINPIINPTIQPESVIKTDDTITESKEEILINDLKHSILDLGSVIYIGSSINETPIKSLGQKLKDLATKLTEEQFNALMDVFQAKVVELETTIGKGRVPLRTVSELLTELNAFCTRLIMCINDMDKKRLEEKLNQLVQNKILPDLPEKIYSKAPIIEEADKNIVLTVYADRSSENYKYYISSTEAAQLGLGPIKEDDDLFEITVMQLIEFEQKFDVQQYDYKTYVKPETDKSEEEKTVLHEGDHDTTKEEVEPVIIRKIVTPHDRLTKLATEAPTDISVDTPEEKGTEELKKKEGLNNSGEHIDQISKTKGIETIEVVPNPIIIPKKTYVSPTIELKEITDVNVYISNEGFYVTPEIAEKYSLNYVIPYLNYYGISESECKEKLESKPEIRVIKKYANFPPIELYLEYAVHDNEISYYLEKEIADKIGLDCSKFSGSYKRLSDQEISLIRNHFKVSAIKRELEAVEMYKPMTEEEIEASRIKLGF